MGIKFLPVRLSDIQEVGDRAALFLAYLRLLSKYAGKDGYINRSASQIARDLSFGRSIQEACRRLLEQKGLVKWRLANKRSPTIGYKVVDKRP
jgi:hypothetical protein